MELGRTVVRAPDLDLQVKAQLQQYPGWQTYRKDTWRDWDRNVGIEVSKTEDHVWQSMEATSTSLSSGCGWQGRGISTLLQQAASGGQQSAIVLQLSCPGEL